MSGAVLWRLVFSVAGLSRLPPHMLGPWHPDRARMEQQAEWFRSLGHEVSVQSNREAGRSFSGGGPLGG